jgi:hypothetical protein
MELYSGVVGQQEGVWVVRRKRFSRRQVLPKPQCLAGQTMLSAFRNFLKKLPKY